MKNKTIIIAITSFALGALIYNLFSPILFQEGNPYPLISGIMRLNFSKEKIVKLDMDGERYITKSKNGKEVLSDFLKNQGYEFTEQMGSGYFFKSSDGDSLIATHRYYSRFYSLWSISSNNKSD